MPQVDKKLTWRVRGLPSGIQKQEFKSFLREQLVEGENLDTLLDSSKDDIDIVPDCTQRERCVALVPLNRTPEFLAEVASGEGAEPSIFDGEDVWFDCTFHGFTQLYATEDSEHVEADIVALSGFGGKAHGSWRVKMGPKRMWLHHFLRKELKWCRTMIYGYDASLLRNKSNTSQVDDYALELIRQLEVIRPQSDEKVRTRPLIFITHSFGGLVAARALFEMHADGRHDDMYNAVHGFLFFGVPFFGLDPKALQDMSSILEAQRADHPQRSLLQNLKPHGELLQRHMHDFKNVFHDRTAITFYETKQTQGPQQDAEGAWKRSGDYNTVSSPESSILGLGPDREFHCGVPKDHSDMVKFDHRHDPTYTVALLQLRNLVKKHSQSIIVNKHYPREEYEVLEAALSRLDQDPLELRHREFFEIPDYRAWRDGQFPILRCYGGVWTGKTVLACMITQDLFKNSSNRNAVLGLFLDASKFERPTVTTLVRQLLGQLTKQRFGSQRPSDDSHQLSRRAASATELETTYEQLEFELKKFSRVYLVLDGWDRCDHAIQEHLEGKFEGLIDKSKIALSVLYTTRTYKVANGTLCNRCKAIEDPEHPEDATWYPCGTSICNICRTCSSDELFWRCEQANSKHILTVAINIKPTKAEIRQYVSSHKRLQDILEEDAKAKAKIFHYIAEFCDRNFTVAKSWIEVLVGKAKTRYQINKALDSETTFFDVWGRILEKELQTMNHHDELWFRRILSDAGCARPAMSWRSLRYAIVIDPEASDDGEPDENVSPREFENLVRGLLDLNDDSFGGIAGDKITLRKYLTLHHDKWHPHGRRRMAKICMKYLRLTPFAKACKNLADIDKKEETCGFWMYALAHWGDHLRDFLHGEHKKELISSAVEFLKDEQKLNAHVQAAWYLLSRVDGDYGIDSCKGVHGLHICGWFGLTALFDLIPRDRQGFDVADSTFGQTPLIYACRRGHLNTVKKLLSLGASVNYRSAKGATPLFGTILSNKKDVVEVLITYDNKRLDINIGHTRRLNGTALILAADLGCPDVVRLLLDKRQKDIKIDQQDDNHQTALDRALLRQKHYEIFEEDCRRVCDYHEVIKQLLQHTGSKLNTKDLEDRIEALQRDRIPVLQQSDLEQSNESCGKNLTPLHEILNEPERLQHLLNTDRGSESLNAPNRSGRTALHVAAFDGNGQAVSILLQHRPTIDLNPKDKWGLTPLLLTQDREFLDDAPGYKNSQYFQEFFACAKALIEAGAELRDTRLNISSLFLHAVASHSLKAARTLHEADTLACTIVIGNARLTAESHAEDAADPEKKEMVTRQITQWMQDISDGKHSWATQAGSTSWYFSEPLKSLARRKSHAFTWLYLLTPVLVIWGALVWYH